LPYIANTVEDQQQMLKTIGCQNLEEMWQKAGVTNPAPELKNFPEGLSEPDLVKHFQHYAEKNDSALTCFLGGGFYDHFIPAAVPALVNRGDFATAYTPYQAEASQGTLQSIFEYQSAICELTGMPVANASLYDGGTAAFEAILMAVRIKRKKMRVVISDTVSPLYRQIMATSTIGHDIDLAVVKTEASESRDNLQALLDCVDDNTAAVVVQYPNFLGGIADYRLFIEKLHAKKVLAISVSYPIAFGMLETPGKMGFDIVVGEGQCLGISLNGGGPYLGYMAVKEEYMRKMPGRVVGKAFDKDGKEGYVLTLQTREQHIRRQHAMSNICSNENLCALTALVYMCLLGKEGIVEVAQQCAAKAVYLYNRLNKVPGCKVVGDGAFFNEFVLELPSDAETFAKAFLDQGIAGGLPLGQFYPERKNQLLVAVTEKRTKAEIDHFCQVLEKLL